jgi:hypothetical protein
MRISLTFTRATASSRLLGPYVLGPSVLGPSVLGRRVLGFCVLGACALAWGSLGASRVTRVASGHPVAAGTVHASPTAKPNGHHPATNAQFLAGGHGTAPAKGTYGGVDRNDPVAVGKAFVRASYTFDTATQASTNPATVSSALWCTPSLRAKMLAELPRGSPGGQWIEWRAHQAVTTVAVDWAAQSGAPPETTRAAYESYDVTVTPHGTHGWRGIPDHYVLWVTLSRTGPKAAWEVATFEVQPWFPSISDK